jgi:DNA-binding Xre family transcriptional regulator
MRLYLKEIAQNKGYRNARVLTQAMTAHFRVNISFSTIYPLWNNEAKLWSIDTLDRLCSFLEVPAGLLIQHIPGEDKRTNEIES